MALENLEQMHPRYLVELVESKQLEEVLNQRVEAFLSTLDRILRKSPTMDQSQAVEIAQAEHLTSVNPDWEEEKPLTKAERAALKAYLSGLQKKKSMGRSRNVD